MLQLNYLLQLIITEKGSKRPHFPLLYLLPLLTCAKVCDSLGHVCCVLVATNMLAAILLFSTRAGSSFINGEHDRAGRPVFFLKMPCKSSDNRATSFCAPSPDITTALFFFLFFYSSVAGGAFLYLCIWNNFA